MLSPTVAERRLQQRREPEDGRAQLVLAPTHVSHRFDEGVTATEAARRLGMDRSTFYRRFDELVARGLVEMPRITKTRVFSAMSIERVLHGDSLRLSSRRR